jgi:1,2-diacylglycerol 3-beta-galactosyltransferase
MDVEVAPHASVLAARPIQTGDVWKKHTLTRLFFDPGFSGHATIRVTMQKLDFLYFDAGGGHRAAATALRQVIEKQNRDWEIRLVNLQEQLDQIDVIRQLTGIRLQDVYNLMLKKGWTLGNPQLIVVMHFLIRLFHQREVRTLCAMWKERQPDMVVSLVPNFNRALGESLSATLPGVPLVTIITDLADYPPHFWMEPVPQYIVCGSDRAVQQALAQGHPPQKVLRASGMVLNPTFYEIPPLTPEQRAAERARLGFRPDEPIGLVLFGGQGSSVMMEIADRLPDRQLLMICGHNEALAQKLRNISHKSPIFVEGFTKEIPRYMQLADYFIGKPGPGSICEAVQMHLPVIVECNFLTLAQERYNTEWVKEHGLGMVVRNFREIDKSVRELLAPENYRKARLATEAMRNRAVFEIPEMLEAVLRSKQTPSALP